MFSKFRGNFKFTLEHTKAGLTSDERQQPNPLRSTVIPAAIARYRLLWTEYNIIRLLCTLGYFVHEYLIIQLLHFGSFSQKNNKPLRYRLRSIVLKLANEKLMTDEAERHVRKITIII
jgi:hypothetical protein